MYDCGYGVFDDEAIDTQERYLVTVNNKHKRKSSSNELLLSYGSWKGTDCFVRSQLPGKLTENFHREWYQFKR